MMTDEFSLNLELNEGLTSKVAAAAVEVAAKEEELREAEDSTLQCSSSYLKKMWWLMFQFQNRRCRILERERKCPVPSARCS